MGGRKSGTSPSLRRIADAASASNASSSAAKGTKNEPVEPAAAPEGTGAGIGPSRGVGSLERAPAELLIGVDWIPLRLSSAPSDEGSAPENPPYPPLPTCT